MNHQSLFRDEKFSEIGKKIEINFETIGIVPIMKLAIKTGGNFFECQEEGPTKEPELTFTQKIRDMHGALLYKFIGENSVLSLWTFDNSIVEISWSANYISMKAISLNEDLVTDLIIFVKGFLTPAETKGQVYAIVLQGGRLAMSSLGDASVSLIQENYTKKVMEDYDLIKEDLSSAYPSGRLAILKGKPGTGKTHLVRALLKDVKRGMFVLVSPDMIKSMGGPELLPLLMQYHAYTPGSIILVIEDADKCLVSRSDKETDTSVIQSILNLGDGILGSMLDIRILATTNAHEFEMDAAILREGRLSCLCDVGPLDYKSAEICYRNLLPNAPAELPSKIMDNEVILARVYSTARANGWKPKEPPPNLCNIDDSDDETFDEEQFDDD